MILGTKLGPYEILAPIGAGGMGEVYRARDTKLKREVALKVLPEAFANNAERMARFQHEAEVLASLNHPNIASIHGVEDHALIMELVEGESPKGPMPFDDAWKIATQIADALEYAHERGIVHRDLKPANVKVTPDGVVKLLDFGLAKAFSETPDSPTGDPVNSPTITLGATVVGTILGTAAYMSPEQAKGKRVDKRADIWSWGVVLYELLTGERMFQGEDAADTLAAVIHKQPDLERVPLKVRRLLAECLQKDPKLRLRDIGDAGRLFAEEAPPEQTAPSRSRLGTIASVAAVVLLLAFAAVSFVHFREKTPTEHTLRYTIATPENSRVHSFAISPDGRYVTLAAAVQGKRQQLWLRALSTLQARELPGTEDATYPFWSPDSRFIGFFAEGKLKKIAASGGPAQSLCDVPDGGRGGSWSSITGPGEDVIVFSPGGGNQVALQQVSAAGGVPTDVSTTKGSYSSPFFLPDGRHFLYLVSGASRFFGDTYLGSLDRNENRRVLADVSQVVFAPSAAGSSTGHLLFVRRNTLMAQPFDARRAQIAGDAVPIAENVSVPQGGPFTPMTVSENSVLVYWTTGSMLNEIVWFDRTGKRLGSVGAVGNVRTPSISPDQKAVVYARITSTSTADLWLWDLGRRTETRLTSDASFNVGPSWSPSGNRIVFRSDRGGGEGDLYQVSASGSSHEELLLATPSGKVDPEWSRDGRFIVYSESDPKTKFDLWVLPVGEDAPAGRKSILFLQTDFSELQGQMSPDSHWMAYSSDESGTREVYVRPFPVAEGKWRISTAGGIQPRWRGDGRELFFVGGDGRMNTVAVQRATGTKLSFEASAPLPLFDSHIVDIPVAYEYDVTADGQRFLVTTKNSPGFSIPLNVTVNWDAGLKK